MMPGNSFTNWSKITPRHNALISKIMESPVHVIATLRSKTEYVINNKDGKNVPEKVGLKAVQREDCEYEFTLAFELQRNHVALVSKDRTGIFKDMYELQLNENLGNIISGWCNAEVKATEKVNPVEVIKSCKTLDELREVYRKHENWQESYKTLFLAMKGKLMTPTNGSMAH